MSKRYLNSETVQRFMSPEEFAAFMAKYDGARKGYRSSRVATDADKAMFADYVGGMKIKEIADKNGVTKEKVRTAIILSVKAN